MKVQGKKKQPKFTYNTSSTTFCPFLKKFCYKLCAKA